MLNYVLLSIESGKLIDYSIKEQIQDIFPMIISSILVFGIINFMYRISAFKLTISLILFSVVGGIIIIISAYLTKQHHLFEMFNYLVNKLKVNKSKINI